MNNNKNIKTRSDCEIASNKEHKPEACGYCLGHFNKNISKPLEDLKDEMPGCCGGDQCDYGEHQEELAQYIKKREQQAISNERTRLSKVYGKIN